MAQRSKEYKEVLPNGTELNIEIKVDVENFNKDDYRELFGRFAGYSRKFYLEELKSAMGAD